MFRHRQPFAALRSPDINCSSSSQHTTRKLPFREANVNNPSYQNRVKIPQQWHSEGRIEQRRFLGASALALLLQGTDPSAWNDQRSVNEASKNQTFQTLEQHFHIKP
ncbi:hypothetical protein KC19_1G146800 [Ceratodon purpureus]|uniref:Uncharacterized protein n=1 Tax=Ceratodon purpureus TaxID=3225 RepID=A0A8T0J7W8_CERPU|nr:hypothetical protein KC19_1G146800 [Ceratodon purpureus]